MSAGVCPRCGAAATGKFCSECGASLAPLACPACGNTPPAGARFCNKCGTALAGGAAGVAGAPPLPGGSATRGDGQLPWWIAGTTLVVLIVLMAWPVINPKKPAPPAPQQA